MSASTSNPTPSSKPNSATASASGSSPGGTNGGGNNAGSPVTGVIDEKSVIIDFGKYEGKTVHEIAALDRAFYERLASERENGVFAIRRHRDKTFRLYINPLSNVDH
jgi:hypothetical protein